MTAVMLSIRPQWCEFIANGRKTIEVRKSRPELETPFKCYIYCTQGSNHLCLMQNPDGVNLIACCNWKTALSFGGSISNGKVIGEFVCDRVERMRYPDDGLVDVVDAQMACLTAKEIITYSNGNPLYGWHISALQIYDKPMELSEFYRYCTEKDDCHKCIHWNRSYDNTYYEPPDPPFEGCMTGEKKHFTRPFQSWGYVEELP